MAVAFTNGIVCILDAKNRPVGTGVVVSSVKGDLVVTCAHVLDETKPGQVTVAFQANNEQREASIIDQWWRSEDAEDIAILQVMGGLPQGVRPLPLGTARGTRGHTIHTFGFPEVGEVDGVLGMGTVLGLGAKTKAGQPLLQIRSSEITAGFSGAPVWDELRQRVIGMVVIVARPDSSGKLGETAFATPTETLQTVCPVLTVSEVCPYRNLDAFTEADARFFFGRARVVDELVASLHVEPRFLAVFGPSGSGKSSVVRAGLISQLLQGKVPGSEHWIISVYRPSDYPFDQLSISWNQSKQTRLMLVIDQFEELFATGSEKLCKEVVVHLTNLLESSPPITIVLVMRDDFYSRFAQNEMLVKWLRRGLVTVSPILKRDELIAIVQEPASILGLGFEDGLVESIVKDAMENAVRGEEGQTGHSTILPLLEFALTRLWEGCPDGLFTHNAYHAIGGVTGGLTQWADQAFYGLEERQRLLARHIFTDLVYLGDEDQQIPNSRRRRSLASLYRNHSERENVEQVVQRLVEARLLVTSRDTQSNQDTVEIIHDALLTEWGQLKRWVAEDRRFLVWHQEFEKRVWAWVKTDPEGSGQHDEDRLLRGRDLVEAESWLIERSGDLDPTEQNFIEVSRERRKREEQQWKNLYEEAERQREEAKHQRQIALARMLAAQAELMRNQQEHLLQRSVLLAVEAMQRFPSLEADQALRSGLVLLRRLIVRITHTGTVNSVAFSPDGCYLATASDDGTVGVWEAVSGRQLARLVHKDIVNAVAFSPDGRYLVSASWDHTVGVWETVSGRLLTFLIHDGPVRALVFSPDGRYLATASDDETAGIWETTSGNRLARLVHKDIVNAVAFSPDGRYLATASDDETLGIWETLNGDQMRCQHLEHIAKVVVFSPDGYYLATASRDGTAEIWEVITGLQHACFIHEGSVNAIAFSPDGRYFATASEDGRVRVLEVAGGHPLIRLTHGRNVRAVIFSPDGNLLATASDDGTAGVWESSTGRQLARLTHQQSVKAVAFSPDGYYMATASGDHTTCVWEVTDTYRITRLIHWKPARTIAFSPDHTHLVAVNESHTVGVWELARGYLIARLAHGGSVSAIAFSPDGKYLATASRDATARVWETMSGSQSAHLYHKGTVNAVTFSPDGKYLATASDDSTARMWQVAEGRWLLSLAHEGSVNAITFSPDSKYLATASGEGTVRIWEATTGRQLVRLPHKHYAKEVIFSPDGTCLATISDDVIARIWNTVTGQQLACLVHDSNINAWDFTPDGKYFATASGNGAIGVWETIGGHRRVHMMHERGTLAIAFSPDGKYLATTSEDRTVGVWEAATGRQLVRLAHDRSALVVTFSLDGKSLLTVSEDGSVGEWLWRPEDLIMEACARLTYNLTQEEWQQHLGDEPYRKICSTKP